MGFRKVPSHPQYEVDELGNVRGPSGRILKASEHRPMPYLQIGIHLPDVGVRTCYVHQMVMEAFVGPRPKGMQIRHLNGDCKDNRLSNLRYGTPEENAADKVLHGTAPEKMTHCARGHEMTADNIIHGRKPSGKPRRQCRECYRVSANASRKALREKRARENVEARV